MHTREKQLEAFGRVLDILDELRKKCPWDRVQTNETLRQNTIEETYELCDALMKNNKNEICKELGDILLHIVFYSKIGAEKGDFDIKNVCDNLCEKLIYRHPHVFAETEVSDSSDVVNNWEQLKLREKGGNNRVLSGVPEALPSMIKAFRIQEKAANVGFDWDTPQGAINKIEEEFRELREEIDMGNKERAEQELGDLLFSIINVARKFGIFPDNALEKTNKKFIDRFNYVEQASIDKGKRLKEMSMEEMDLLWDGAKKRD